MVRTSALVLAGAIALLAGCAKKPAAREVETAELTGARVRSNVNVSDELKRVCAIHVGNVDRAPKFGFDESELLASDRDILAQVAKCVTEGPMKGRDLSLVGRADPRGESEYNMVLGGHRADSVRDYLAKLGVGPERLTGTSRGELDAEGKDEAGFARDRRVDIALK